VMAVLVAPQPMLLAAPWRLQFLQENHGACVAVVAFSPNAKLTDIAQLLDREKAVITRPCRGSAPKKGSSASWRELPDRGERVPGLTAPSTDARRF
jgi:hypothetical protein